MFYVLKKEGKVIENYNAKKGSGPEADKEAMERAEEKGADAVVTSDGRKVK